MSDGGTVSNKYITAGLTILVAIMGVGTISALVSKQSDTPNVLASLGATFSKILCAATQPITGKDCGIQQTTSVSSSIDFGGFGSGGTGGGAGNSLPFGDTYTSGVLGGVFQGL